MTFCTLDYFFLLLHIVLFVPLKLRTQIERSSSQDAVCNYLYCWRQLLLCHFWRVYCVHRCLIDSRIAQKVIGEFSWNFGYYGSEKHWLNSGNDPIHILVILSYLQMVQLSNDVIPETESVIGKTTYDADCENFGRYTCCSRHCWFQCVWQKYAP